MSRQHPDDDDAVDIKGSVDIVENDYGEYDDEDDHQNPTALVNQPFYTYDDQNDEQFYIIDNDSYDHPNSVDPANNSDCPVDGSQTVEEVKHRLINDPQYRRELLERVLP